MALILRRLGYDDTEAALGLDAVYQARAARPDLIFMDLSLPRITGVEATARLKQIRPSVSGGSSAFEQILVMAQGESEQTC